MLGHLKYYPSTLSIVSYGQYNSQITRNAKNKKQKISPYLKLGSAYQHTPNNAATPRPPTNKTTQNASATTQQQHHLSSSRSHPYHHLISRQHHDHHYPPPQPMDSHPRRLIWRLHHSFLRKQHRNYHRSRSNTALPPHPPTSSRTNLPPATLIRRRHHLSQNPFMG